MQKVAQSQPRFQLYKYSCGITSDLELVSLNVGDTILSVGLRNDLNSQFMPMNSNVTGGEALLSPRAFVHAVLRTSPDSFPSMVDFYKKLLTAKAAYENDFVSFLRYDEEHHRIAIMAVPNTAPKNHKACGLDHLAFAFDTLHDLVTFYKQKKAAGILPVWCTNHGPATSIYYQDPDGNKIETQVDNMDADSATAFMYSEAFAKNPIGADFDPEELVRRVESGEDEAVIKKRRDVGPRGVDDY